MNRIHCTEWNYTTIKNSIMAKIQEMIEKASSELMIVIPSFAKSLAERYSHQILSKTRENERKNYVDGY